jgi:hypothetical protein
MTGAYIVCKAISSLIGSTLTTQISIRSNCTKWYNLPPSTTKMDLHFGNLNFPKLLCVSKYRLPLHSAALNRIPLYRIHSIACKISLNCIELHFRYFVFPFPHFIPLYSISLHSVAFTPLYSFTAFDRIPFHRILLHYIHFHLIFCHLVHRTLKPLLANTIFLCISNHCVPLHSYALHSTASHCIQNKLHRILSHCTQFTAFRFFLPHFIPVHSIHCIPLCPARPHSIFIALNSLHSVVLRSTAIISLHSAFNSIPLLSRFPHITYHEIDHIGTDGRPVHSRKHRLRGICHEHSRSHLQQLAR